MDEKLRLNRDTGCYEATITLAVEAEILQRALAQYIEEHHVDISNPDEVQRAVELVSKLSRWVDHPRTKKIVRAVSASPVVQGVPLACLADEWKHDFRARALATPVEEWETLLTPLAPTDAEWEERKSIYRRRDEEKAVLKKLGKELEPPPNGRIEAIAEAMKANSLK